MSHVTAPLLDTIEPDEPNDSTFAPSGRINDPTNAPVREQVVLTPTNHATAKNTATPGDLEAGELPVSGTLCGPDLENSSYKGSVVYSGKLSSQYLLWADTVVYWHAQSSHPLGGLAFPARQGLIDIIISAILFVFIQGSGSCYIYPMWFHHGKLCPLGVLAATPKLMV